MSINNLRLKLKYHSNPLDLLLCHITFELNLKQKTNTTQSPLGRLLLRFQVEIPYKSRTSLLRLVHGTLINILLLLAVHWYRLDKHNRHQRSQILQLTLGNLPQVTIPPGALHIQPIHIGTLAWSSSQLISCLLQHINTETHLIQRPLILAGRCLHDWSQEGLWIEQASKPDGWW